MRWCGEREHGPDGEHPVAGDGDGDKKYLKDYKKPEYLVDKVRLEFILDDEGLNTEVYSKLIMRLDCHKKVPLVLDGEMLELIPGTLKVNNNLIPTDKFQNNSDNGRLVIDSSILPGYGETFTVESNVKIKPAENLTLSGLYMSAGTYCTQCEGKSTFSNSSVHDFNQT